MGAGTTFHEFTHPSGLADKYAPFPCTTETVDLAAALYATDVALLGYTFTDAYDTCRRLGRSE